MSDRLPQHCLAIAIPIASLMWFGLWIWIWSAL